jgi:hypothetical protein
MAANAVSAGARVDMTCRPPSAELGNALRNGGLAPNGKTVQELGTGGL